MNSAIETNHLIKRFGAVTAVDDLSLRVARGEIYAFLGLNGAGKTTTIRMLLDIIKPTAGDVRILGQRVDGSGSPPWAAVGYMVDPCLS
jgi:ABC-2 type transport system ATP-binding protein